MEVCSYFSHICTHMHAHTQLLIYTCTHASMYTCTHVALYRRQTHRHSHSFMRAYSMHTHLPHPTSLLLHTSFHTVCRCGGQNRSQSRVETHLEVSVDDPHLVTMENSLQDLLDAVTMANSRQVSQMVWGWPGREQQQEAWGKAGCGHWGSIPSLGEQGGCRELWGKAMLATRERRNPCSAPRAAILVLALPLLLGPGLLKSEPDPQS